MYKPDFPPTDVVEQELLGIRARQVKTLGLADLKIGQHEKAVRLHRLSQPPCAGEELQKVARRS